MEEGADGLAEGFGVGVAEEVLGDLVEGFYLAEAVEDHDAVGRAFEKQISQRPGFEELVAIVFAAG